MNEKLSFSAIVFPNWSLGTSGNKRKRKRMLQQVQHLVWEQASVVYSNDITKGRESQRNKGLPLQSFWFTKKVNYFSFAILYGRGPMSDSVKG